MAWDLIHAATMADYARNNVLPASRKVPAQTHGFHSVATVLFAPDAIDPLQVSGGFNSVIELSASTCRQQVANALNPIVLDRSLGSTALTDLLTAAAPTGTLAELLRASAN